MKKREMPTALFLVGLGLLLFFIYAVFTIGMNVHETISANQSTVGLFIDSCMRFVSDNKLVLALAAAILVVVKLFVGSPRAARY
jgi:hypothetical protein